jgi:hypothetical protein
VEVATIIGVTGMVLVFLSFIVKRWAWLYSFNLAGTTLLAIYAYMQKDLIFLIVETGLVFFLAYRLLNEVKNGSSES